VDAYDVRADGIVVLDSSKCMGCGYCAWACPYGAPQYNPEAGNMTKCDFCLDQLEQGLPPACVTACPMRVLDYDEADAKHELALWNVPPESHPFPLPTFSHTQPRLAIQPHIAMINAQEKSVANLEEIQPRKPSAWEEVPLILFTLLGQLAVGGFWAMSWIFPPLWTLADRLTMPLRLIPHLLVGISLGIGLLASFAHLGTKRNAWRALTHLRHSWLSREVLFAGIFGFGWLVTALEGVFFQCNTDELTSITAILGIGLVYSMGQVYRIPAAPGWNSWRTNAGFFVSAVLLGLSAMSPLLSYEARMTGTLILPIFWMFIGSSILLGLLAQLAMLQKRTSDVRLQIVRVGVILLGVVLTVAGIVYPVGMNWLGLMIFLAVLVEEALGRWLFYRSRM
jgi:DMSO reductase anchor subunit